MRILALLALALATPAPAQLQKPALDFDRFEAAIDAAHFSGDLLFSNRGAPDLSIILDSTGHIGTLPQPSRGDRDGLTWRWASVTKQIVAILVMQEVDRGQIALDQPVSRYLPAFRSANAATVTVRQLLQHQSGLPDPDLTDAGTTGMPAFYRPGYTGSRDPLSGYCAGPVTGPPGGKWSYNNCDYIVAGALLRAVTGKTWQKLAQERVFGPLKLKSVGAYPGERFTRIGLIDGKKEPPIDLASFGAAAGLYGSPYDLLALDFALMDGKLLSRAALDEMWRGDPALGYMALGQWVFEARIAGCAKPVRIVERRGGIGGVEIRNLIMPDYHVALVAFSDRTPFDFGEIWTGKGFSHDLLSAVLCPAPAKP